MKRHAGGLAAELVARREAVVHHPAPATAVLHVAHEPAQLGIQGRVLVRAKVEFAQHCAPGGAVRRPPGPLRQLEAHPRLRVGLLQVQRGERETAGCLPDDLAPEVGDGPEPGARVVYRFRGRTELAGLLARQPHVSGFLVQAPHVGSRRAGSRSARVQFVCDHCAPARGVGGDRPDAITGQHAIDDRFLPAPQGPQPDALTSVGERKVARGRGVTADDMDRQPTIRYR